MLTEEELRLEARLAAIEQLLAKVANGMMLHFDPDEFEQLMHTYAESLEQTSVPGLEPALADVFAAQFRDEPSASSAPFVPSAGGCPVSAEG